MRTIFLTVENDKVTVPLYGICGRLQPITAKVPTSQLGHIGRCCGDETKRPKSRDPVGSRLFFIPWPDGSRMYIKTGDNGMTDLQRILSTGTTPTIGLFAPPPGSDCQRDSDRPIGLSTAAVHAGEERQKHGNAITDAIFCSSTFTFSDTQAVIDFIEQKQTRAEYGRYGAPGEKVVEAKLAALDGGEETVLFSSGMAAVTALLLANLRSGDEVVFFDECYHRTRQLCQEHLGRLGVVSHQVPTGDYPAMEAAINEKTRLLISESPTNPHLSCIDVGEFAAIGRRHGVKTVIDATLATPCNLRPIQYGVDYVVHSATKYLGGHNDLLAGSVTGPESGIAEIRKIRGLLGSVISPHSTYLLSRGLKTLELRMDRHNENGIKVASFLESHPRIERVFYPGLASHPSHRLAKSQMDGFGGVVTFEVAGADWRETARVVDSVKIPRIGPSLGGVESLIEQPLVMSYYECTVEQRREYGITDNMVRLALGIENPQDLVDDLAQALKR